MKITFKYHYQYKVYQFEIDSIGFSINKDCILLKFNSIIEHINDLNRFIKADAQAIEIEDKTAFSNVFDENQKTYIQNIKYYELTQNSGDDLGSNYIYFFFNTSFIFSFSANI